MRASPSRALCLAFALMQTNLVRADVLIELVIYSNQNDTMQDAAQQETSTLMDTLLGAESSDYEALEPGETVPAGGNRRGLRLPLTGANRLPRAGSGRNLQVKCPPKCATSTTTYCKVLGCTKCGQTCQGRLLRMLLDEGEAAAVVADMNDVLVPYCGEDSGCDIGAKILSVNPDGTTSELV